MAFRGSPSTLKKFVVRGIAPSTARTKSASSIRGFSFAASLEAVQPPSAARSPRPWSAHQCRLRSQQRNHSCLTSSSASSDSNSASPSTVRTRASVSRNSLDGVAIASRCRVISRPSGLRPVTGRRPLCSRSNEEVEGNGNAKDNSSSSTSNFDIHVTHVDAASAKAEREEGDGVSGSGGERMMPEEDRKPLGTPTAAAAKEGSGQDPTTIRFMDVPGSEETREEKMTAVFTCTVCDTRTAKTFAKLSYNKGVVIARCPGCHNLHLIADRLGWFEEAGDAKGGWDIEKITNKIGEADCHVVNENNVMELNLVDIVGKSGAQNTGVSSDSSPAASDSKNKD